MRRIYEAIGAFSAMGAFDGAPNPKDVPACEEIRVLREHRFDKRAALAAVAEHTYEAFACDGTTYAARAFEGSYWDRFRRELAWSDWPAASATRHYDGRYGVDPLDEPTRLTHWGAASTGRAPVAVRIARVSQRMGTGQLGLFDRAGSER